MELSRNETAQLNRVIAALQKFVVKHSKAATGSTGKQNARKPEHRIRRSGKELAAFRKMLVAERKKGVPVATLAKRHGISTTYIYQL
jgi:hypothetical protein